MMPKITEKRFIEIMHNECDVIDHLKIKAQVSLIDKPLTNPEIKSLFEKNIQSAPCLMCNKAGKCRMENLKGVYECFEFREFGYKGVTKDKACSKCGKEYNHDYPRDECFDCGQKLIWPTEPPAPVAEYDIVEYKTVGNKSTTECKNRLPNVGTIGCREVCQTNGLQNFAGHEVENSSIRCKHRFNVGGEG
jgi:DNA-directed RNA polymerase subunit RPC12/RpoP